MHLLLESGANPNACDIKKKTPLALAAQNGHLNVVEVLLQKGNHNNTFIALVLEQIHLSIHNVVYQIICVHSGGASVCCESESGTILFEAAASGNPDIISLLLDHGADPNRPLYSGHLPIHRVAYHGHIL